MRATEREVGYSGALGSGKTLAVCFKAALRAQHRGAREGLCRKHLVTLKATTLRTLLEGDGRYPPVLPPSVYEHHKGEKIIRIIGGGEIVYFGLDEPEKIGSYNLTGCGIDQAEELSESDYTALRGRTRVVLPNVGNQIYWACNPGSPDHFLCKRFGLAGGPATKGCVAFHTATIDNPHLPAEYVADLATLTGMARARYFEGRWVAAEGLVYDQWNPEVHVRHRRFDAARVVLCVDEGYTNPFAVLRLEVDGDGRAHVRDERYQSGMLMPSKVAAIRELGGAQAECIAIDPSAADLIAQVRDAGMNAVEADNAVSDGIARVQGRLANAGDGEPRLTVEPGCVNLIREMGLYLWATAKGGSIKEAPVKRDDHAPDALRYGIAEIDRDRLCVLVGSVDPRRSEDGDDDDWHWRPL